MSQPLQHIQTKRFLALSRLPFIGDMKGHTVLAWLDLFCPRCWPGIVTLKALIDCDNRGEVDEVGFMLLGQFETKS